MVTLFPAVSGGLWTDLPFCTALARCARALRRASRLRGAQQHFLARRLALLRTITR